MFLIGILQKNTGLIIASQFLIGHAYGGYAALIIFWGTAYGTFHVTNYINNLVKKVEGTAAGITESLGNLG